MTAAEGMAAADPTRTPAATPEAPRSPATAACNHGGIGGIAVTAVIAETAANDSIAMDAVTGAIVVAGGEAAVPEAEVVAAAAIAVPSRKTALRTSNSRKGPSY